MDVKTGLIQPISTELGKGLRMCLTHCVISSSWGGQSIVVCVIE